MVSFFCQISNKNIFMFYTSRPRVKKKKKRCFLGVVARTFVGQKKKREIEMRVLLVQSQWESVTSRIFTRFLNGIFFFRERVRNKRRGSDLLALSHRFGSMAEKAWAFSALVDLCSSLIRYIHATYVHFCFFFEKKWEIATWDKYKICLKAFTVTSCYDKEPWVLLAHLWQRQVKPPLTFVVSSYSKTEIVITAAQANLFFSFWKRFFAIRIWEQSCS